MLWPKRWRRYFRNEIPTVESLLAEQANPGGGTAAGGAEQKGTVVDDNYGAAERQAQQAATGNEAPAAAGGQALNATEAAALEGNAAPGAKGGTPGGSADPAAAQATTPGGQASSEYQSVREFAQQLGIDPKGFDDDDAFLRHVLAQAQRAPQLEQLAQYGQVYVQNADQFTAWQRQQAEAAQRAQEKPKPKAPWEGPEYDPRWESMIEADAAGGYKVRPGYDPSVLPKYLAHQEHRRAFAQKLLNNPAEVLGGVIEEKATEIAKKLVADQLQQHQAAEYQRTFTERNPWIHAKDAAGNVIVNPANNKPYLSETGEVFARAWEKGERLGVQGFHNLEQYATDLTLLHLQRGKTAAAKAPAQAEQQRQAVIQANRQAPNRGGSTLGNQGIQTPPQNENLDLREMLAADFAAAGFKLGDAIADD